MTFKEKLFNVQTQIEAVKKTKENPFFKNKHADINSVLETLSPHLERNKLLLTQPIINGNVVTTVSDVEGDEFITSSFKLPDTEDSQKIGSAITYGRRYSLVSLFCMEQEDDDGNKAAGKKVTPNVSDDELDF